MPDSIDPQILEEIISGKKDRFSELVEQLGPLAYHFFFQRCGKNPELARDLTQEAFLRTFENLSSFRPEGSFKPWFMAICRNLLLNNQRRRNLEKSNLGNHVLVQSMPDFENDSVKKHLLRKVMDVLPQIQRDVVEMKFFFGMTCEEIAKALEIPTGTVKSHLSQSRMRLMELLEESET